MCVPSPKQSVGKSMSPVILKFGKCIDNPIFENVCPTDPYFYILQSKKGLLTYIGICWLMKINIFFYFIGFPLVIENKMIII